MTQEQTAQRTDFTQTRSSGTTANSRGGVKPTAPNAPVTVGKDIRLTPLRSRRCGGRDVPAAPPHPQLCVRHHSLVPAAAARGRRSLDHTFEDPRFRMTNDPITSQHGQPRTPATGCATGAVRAAYRLNPEAAATCYGYRGETGIQELSRDGGPGSGYRVRLRAQLPRQLGEGDRPRRAAALPAPAWTTGRTR
jgi:hypothetical protein